MTNHGRIATAHGVMLADSGRLGNALLAAGELVFDPQFWLARDELKPVVGGRGGAYFIGSGQQQWVLRHFRRGGFVANLSKDRYFWLGEQRVRAFAELQLLDFMAQAGLPVPRPVAAGYRRFGLTYACDLITERLAGAEPLSALLAADLLKERAWRAVGATIRRFHDAGIDHADLNAHNVLCQAQQSVSLIDFDRGQRRPDGAWKRGNLERLKRSLEKIARPMPDGRFGTTQWQWLEEGYAARA